MYHISTHSPFYLFVLLAVIEPIPMLCDSVQCPAEADMQCPEDSAIREINAVDLIASNVIPGTTTEVTTTALGNSSSSSLVSDRDFAQCCLTKKCVCKTCHIPSCESENGEVVVELEPESMDTPGQCCGEYECKPEPNCTEVWDTEYYWLHSCRRCNCQKGLRICQHSCDEAEVSSNAICESKRLGIFFGDGESWVEGCYQCDCVHGEPKCVIPFCSHVDCPSERQVTLKDDCCPVCWPKGEPMPHEKLRHAEHDEHDDLLDDYVYSDKHSSNIISSTISSSSPSTSSSTPSSSTPSTPPSSSSTTATPPCQLHEFPNVVNVVHPSSNLNEYVYHIVIVVLVITIALMYFYIRHLLAKQRSYRPVSNFDDKV